MNENKKSDSSLLAGTRSISFCYSFVKNTKHLYGGSGGQNQRHTDSYNMSVSVKELC